MGKDDVGRGREMRDRERGEIKMREIGLGAVFDLFIWGWGVGKDEVGTEVNV